MKLLDRLLVKAGGNKEWVLMGFVHDRGGSFEASYSFWDGTPRSGSPYDGHSVHMTSAEAVEAIQRAAEAFPHPLAWSNVVVDDYGDADE